MIRWTKANRSKLHGFRSAHKTDPEGIALTPSEAAAALRAHAIAYPVEWRADEKFQAALDRVLSELNGDAVPTVDPATEVYRAAVVLRRGTEDDAMRWEDGVSRRALIGLWASRGTATALDILLGIVCDPSPALAVEQQISVRGDVRTVRGLFTDPDPSLPSRSPFTLDPRMWEALRCHVGKLAEADFEAANRVAHARRTALPEKSAERAGIALAFDRDERHAAVEAHAAMEGGGHADPVLLVALRDPALAAQLHRERLPHADLGPVAYDLVESFGEGARPMLEDSLAKLGASYYGGQKYLRAALELLG